MARTLLTVESRSAGSLPSGVHSGLPAEAQAGELSSSSSSGWRRTRGVRLTALSSRPTGWAPRVTGRSRTSGRSPQGGEAPRGRSTKTSESSLMKGGVPPSAVGDYGDSFGGAVSREVAGRFRQRRDLSVDGG
jgi:hypothetical protein